ncbi:MAG TPA: hypothetical protein VF064_19765 [Pyrinomonadaceae bacterium]
MSEKRSKYDTDPLDPDFVRRTEEVMERTRSLGREPQPEPARREPATAEEPTRRFDEQFANSYPSVFVPPVYQPPAHGQGYTSFGADAQQQQPPTAAAPGPSSFYDPAGARPMQRPVQKLGIAENIACVLPYAPFYIGLIAAIVELLIVPRNETRTRFHAAQGLALQLVLIAGTLAFKLIGSLTASGFGGGLFWMASCVFLIVSMFRVWEGKPHHLAPLDDATRRLNEKFEPQVK